MLVDNGVVKTLNVEAPGKYEVSDAETLLKQMGCNEAMRTGCARSQLRSAPGSAYAPAAVCPSSCSRLE